VKFFLRPIRLASADAVQFIGFKTGRHINLGRVFQETAMEFGSCGDRRKTTTIHRPLSAFHACIGQALPVIQKASSPRDPDADQHVQTAGV
jgi:hypothetical protein